MTFKTEAEIQGLNIAELAKYYGELKDEEAEAEERFASACRNVAVGGITSHHQQLLGQIKLVEERFSQVNNMIALLSGLDAVKDMGEVKAVAEILENAAAGKEVPADQLERAQAFVLSILEGCNARRPRPEMRCEPISRNS